MSSDSQSEVSKYRSETPPLRSYINKGFWPGANGPLFRPVKNNTTQQLRKTISPRSVLRDVVQHYAQEIGLAKEVQGLCTHSLRATGATNALAHGVDIAEVQAWLGHADISTTKLYDHRRRRPEESPTFRVRY